MSDNMFYIGTSVDKSPANGLNTLYIDGPQSVSSIMSRIDKNNNIRDEIQHLYFGYNGSFNPQSVDDLAKYWQEWELTIHHFLKQGYWVTLDLDVAEVLDLHESGLTEKHRFIPLISIKIPCVSLLNYNATIKITDQIGSNSNPGTWCVGLQQMLDRANYTPSGHINANF